MILPLSPDINVNGDGGCQDNAGGYGSEVRAGANGYEVLLEDLGGHGYVDDVRRAYVDVRVPEPHGYVHGNDPLLNEATRQYP